MPISPVPRALQGQLLPTRFLTNTRRVARCNGVKLGEEMKTMRAIVLP